MTKTAFKNLVEKLKLEKYHIWYSKKEGWCWLSYCGIREKLELGMTDQQIQDKLFYIKPLS